MNPSWKSTLILPMLAVCVISGAPAQGDTFESQYATVSVVPTDDQSPLHRAIDRVADHLGVDDRSRWQLAVEYSGTPDPAWNVMTPVDAYNRLAEEEQSADWAAELQLWQDWFGQGLIDVDTWPSPGVRNTLRPELDDLRRWRDPDWAGDSELGELMRAMHWLAPRRVEALENILRYEPLIQSLELAESLAGQGGFVEAESHLQAILSQQALADPFRDRVLALQREVAPQAMSERVAGFIASAQNEAAHGRFGQAETLLRQGLEMDPGNTDLEAQIVSLSQEQASQREAAAAEAQQRLREQVESHLGLARQLHSQQEFARAAQEFQAALALDPANSEALEGLRRSNEDIAAAQEQARRAGIADQITRARAALESGGFQGAINLANAVIQRDPANSEALEIITDSRQRQEELAAEQSLAQRQRQLDMAQAALDLGDPRAAIQAANAVLQSTPREERAIEIINRAREMISEREQAALQARLDDQLARAQTALDLGDFRGAIVQANGALSQDPNSTRARVIVAQAEQGIRDAQAASRAVEIQSHRDTIRGLLDSNMAAGALEELVRLEGNYPDADFRSEFGSEIMATLNFSQIQTLAALQAVAADALSSVSEATMNSEANIGERALFMGTVSRIDRGTYVVRSDEGLLFAFLVDDPGLAGRSWGVGSSVAVFGRLQGLSEQMTPEGALARMQTVSAECVIRR